MKKLLALTLMLTSCGSTIRVKGGTDNKVETSGETTYTIKIDFSICNEIKDQEKKDNCLETLLQIMDRLSAIDALKNGNTTAGTTGTK